MDSVIKQHIAMQLTFFSFPFMWISNVNIRCGQQYHDPSTMETGKELQHSKTDGTILCNFNKSCEVEIIKLVLRPKIPQLYSEIRSRAFWTILYLRGSLFILRIDNLCTFHWLYEINMDIVSVFNMILLVWVVWISFRYWNDRKTIQIMSLLHIDINFYYRNIVVGEYWHQSLLF